MRLEPSFPSCPHILPLCGITVIENISAHVDKYRIRLLIVRKPYRPFLIFLSFHSFPVSAIHRDIAAFDDFKRSLYNLFFLFLRLLRFK